jgi:L-fucose dehydrogenase
MVEMDLALAGKTVVVTGGASGIGEAVVRALAAEDAIPVIVDRDEEAGRRVRDELAALGRRCELVVADLAEPGACRAAIDSATRAAGRIDALGQGGTSGYAAAKGAILALTREWAVDLLPYGVRVNAIVPAEVMTPQYRQWIDAFPDPEGKMAAIVEKIPLGRRMTAADEVAAMVLVLLSPQAGHITGQHLFVDGGYVHLDRAIG